MEVDVNIIKEVNMKTKVQKNRRWGSRAIAILLAAMMAVCLIPDIGRNGGVYAMAVGGKNQYDLNWTWDDELSPKTLTIDTYTYKKDGKDYTQDYMYGRKKEYYPWNDFRPDIEKVEIKPGVVNVGSETFIDCTSLHTISFPNTGGGDFLSYFYVGSDSFKNCTDLKSVTFPVKIRIGANAFENTGLTKLEFPSGFWGAGDEAFANCSDLKEVIYKGTMGAYDVAGVEWGVYYNCTKLEKVELSTDASFINSQAFKNCRKLSSIKIPATMKRIEDEAFSGCESLTDITIPTGVLLLGEETFKDCSSLGSLTIPDTVLKIGEDCFKGCTNLTLTVTAPSAAFDYAKSNGIPYTIQNGGKLGDSIEWYVDKTANELVVAGTGAIPDYETVGPWYSLYKDKITKIIVSDGITRIGNNAFKGLTKATEVSLGTSVKEIGDNAFAACAGIKNVDIPVKVEKIGNGAFEDCASIEKVSIPANTSNIGDNAFNGCSSLGEVNIPASVTSIGKDAFKNTSKNTKIITEDGSAAADYAAENGIACTSKTSAEIKAEEEEKKKAEEEAKKKTEEPSKTQSTTAQQTTEQSTKNVPKKGAVITDGKFSYKVTKAGTTKKTTGTVTLTKAKNKNIKNAVIGATVKIDGITYKITAIANGAFKNSKKLTSVTIGANVTSIGKNAFTGCGSLKTITIKGKSLKKIGANAFKGINKKATIKVPKTKKKAYTKLLKNKGQAKTVKIK